MKNVSAHPSMRNSSISSGLKRSCATMCSGAAVSGGLARYRVKEQRLSHSRLHRFGQERLGDQIGRFGPLAREQTFRIGGDEARRDVAARQNIRHGVDARSSFAEIDIRKHEAGPLGLCL